MSWLQKVFGGPKMRFDIPEEYDTWTADGLIAKHGSACDAMIALDGSWGMLSIHESGRLLARVGLELATIKKELDHVSGVQPQSPAQTPAA